MASTYPGSLDSLSTASANSTASNNTHPALHNDANSAINAIQATLGTNPQGAAASVSARILAVEGVGVSTITDVYLAGSHTWTKDAAAKLVHVFLVGAGAGGISGSTAANAVAASGGGGGAPGASVYWSFLPAELSATVAISVPTSTGGVATSANSSPGQAPAQPADCTFGTYITAKSGLVGTPTVTGGSATSFANLAFRGGQPTSTGTGANGGAGAPGNAPSAQNFIGTPMGGAGGGGISGANTSQVGAAGGTWNNATVVFPSHAGATAGAANGGAGAAGASVGLVGLGGAGGGGGNGAGGNGGAGGAGGFPGGGGGGGGGARNGSSSGAGGKGGDGVCVVVQYL